MIGKIFKDKKSRWYKALGTAAWRTNGDHWKTLVIYEQLFVPFATLAIEEDKFEEQFIEVVPAERVMLAADERAKP